MIQKVVNMMKRFEKGTFYDIDEVDSVCSIVNNLG